MSASWERRTERLEETMQPKPRPRPDMTNWTTQERVKWEVNQSGLQAMVQAMGDSDGPELPEVADARDARDEALLAERAAKAAADAWTRDPTGLRLERRVRETREAADKAVKAAERAQRLAEDAVRRPRPPKPAVEPQPAPDAAAPAEPEPKAKPKRQRKRREPGQPKPEKQWWEERAKWRLRGAADYDWKGDVRYSCITEYDPLDREEDYDPFGE